MSLTFSRRSFLKYTAVAAVAVAGSSLLTGCKDNPYQPTGTIGDTLSIMGDFTMKSATYAGGTLTCAMTFKCTSKRGLSVVPANFQVDVYDKDEKLLKTYRSDSTGSNVSLDNPKGDLTKDNDAWASNMICKDMVALNEGDIVKVKYWPRAQASEGLLGYTEAYATWSMKYDATKRAFVKV